MGKTDHLAPWQWKKGQPSPCPTGGRTSASDEFYALARLRSPDALRKLIELLSCGDRNVELKAAIAIMDRGYGKPKEHVEVQRIDTPIDMPALRSRLQELLQIEPPTIEGEMASLTTESIQPTLARPTAPNAGHSLLFRGTRLFVRLSDSGDYRLWMRLGTGDDELIYDGEFAAVLAKAADLAEHDGPWLPDEWVVLDADGQVVSY